MKVFFFGGGPKSVGGNNVVPLHKSRARRTRLSRRQIKEVGIKHDVWNGRKEKWPHASALFSFRWKESDRKKKRRIETMICDFLRRFITRLAAITTDTMNDDDTFGLLYHRTSRKYRIVR